MAKPPTEKNEQLKQEMLKRVDPAKAEKFEARRRIKAELLDAIEAGDLDTIKKLKDNKWGIDITLVWWKKNTDPRIKKDMDACEFAAKKKKQDIVDWFESL